MNIVGTPYNEVQRCAWTVCRVASGSNPSPGNTMAAPCVMQASAPITMPNMIHRHRNAHRVLVGVVHHLTDEEPVVQDVMVRQRRTLRQAGGAGGELDVDRIVKLQRPRQFPEPEAIASRP